MASLLVCVEPKWVLTLSEKEATELAYFIGDCLADAQIDVPGIVANVWSNLNSAVIDRGSALTTSRR